MWTFYSIKYNLKWFKISMICHLWQIKKKHELFSNCCGLSWDYAIFIYLFIYFYNGHHVRKVLERFRQETTKVPACHREEESIVDGYRERVVGAVKLVETNTQHSVCCFRRLYSGLELEISHVAKSGSIPVVWSRHRRNKTLEHHHFADCFPSTAQRPTTYLWFCYDKELTERDVSFLVKQNATKTLHKLQMGLVEIRLETCWENSFRILVMILHGCLWSVSVQSVSPGSHSASFRGLKG